jgi:hypothetical protein
MFKYKNTRTNLKPFINAFFLLVAISMVFVFGILIGQRNLYNQTTKTNLVIKNENGSAQNLFSEIQNLTIWGLDEKPVSVGSFSYYTRDKVVYFKMDIASNYYILSGAGGQKKNIPLEYDLYTNSVVLDQKGVDSIKDVKIGGLDLKKVGNGLAIVYYGQYNQELGDKGEPLQVKQIVLKVKDKVQDQNMYLYNDKTLPESLNGTNMPYFWIKF